MMNQVNTTFGTSMPKDQSVTIAKGIGILLMVLGHSGCPMYMIRFIYMFHVPLFFLMSGYCFKEKYLQDSKTFLWRRIKGLYWPLVKYNILFIALHNVLCSIHIYPESLRWGEHVYSGILGNSIKIATHLQYSEPLLGGFWFLRELFLGSVLAYFAMRLTGKYRKYAFSPLVIIGVLFRHFDIDIFPHHIAINFMVFYAAAFVAFGYTMKGVFKKIPNNKIVVLSLIIVTIVSAIVYPKHEVFNQTTLSMLPYLITSTCGTFMVLLLSKRITRMTSLASFFSFCGNNTLTILTWHFLSFKLISLAIVFIFGFPIECLSNHPIIQMPSFWWVAYFFMGVLLPIIVAYWGDLLILKVKRITKRKI